MVTDVQIVPIEELEVVSLELAKKHLRIEPDFTDEDDIIQACIDGAVAASENYLNGAIAEKIMTITLDKFESPLIFEACPLQTVDSVTYFDKDTNTEKTIDASNYKLTNQNWKVFQLRFLSEIPKTSERFDAVTVTLKIGYEAGKVPKPIISAILLQIGDLFERREDRGDIGFNSAATNLLRPYRKL